MNYLNERNVLLAMGDTFTKYLLVFKPYIINPNFPIPPLSIVVSCSKLSQPCSFLATQRPCEGNYYLPLIAELNERLPREAQLLRIYLVHLLSQKATHWIDKSMYFISRHWKFQKKNNCYGSFHYEFSHMRARASNHYLPQFPIDEFSIKTKVV